MSAAAPLDAFETAGSSPPSAEEVEALSTLLAEAIVRDMRKYPNLADAKAALNPTVVTPSGRQPRSRRCRAVRVVPAAA